MCDATAVAVPKPPLALDTFAKCVNNQINYWGVDIRKNHKRERDGFGMPYQNARGAPKLFATPLLASFWEQMVSDYDDKVIEGVSRLRQLSSITDTKADCRRAALTARKRDGVLKPLRQCPRTFEMEEECGYWMRSVVPRMEEAVEKGGFDHAMAKIIGSADTHQSNLKPKGRGRTNK